MSDWDDDYEAHAFALAMEAEEDAHRHEEHERAIAEHFDDIESGATPEAEENRP